MWTMKYIVAVFAVTIVTAIVGIILWNSSDSRTLIVDATDSPGIVWSLGPADAPVVLESFPDFT